MNRALFILVNVVAFNVCWSITILGVGQSWWWAGPALIASSAALQTLRSPSPGPEAGMLAVGAAAGVLLDGLAAACGIFHFQDGTVRFIVVFAALWVNFGTTVRPSLSWLWNRPMLAAALGAIVAPLNYLIAARLEAIIFNEPIGLGVAWVAAQYALVLPLWMLSAPRLINAPAGTDRPPTGPASTPATGTPAP